MQSATLAELSLDHLILLKLEHPRKIALLERDMWCTFPVTTPKLLKLTEQIKGGNRYFRYAASLPGREKPVAVAVLG